MNVHLFVQASDTEAVGEIANAEVVDDNDDIGDDVRAARDFCSVTSESHKTPLTIAGYF